MNSGQQKESQLHLIERALPLWSDMQHATAVLLNVSENIMYRIDTKDGAQFVLRLHRQNNHKSLIKSELAWVHALQLDGVFLTPDVIHGVNGQAIQSLRTTNNTELFLVMFKFIDGREPDDTDDVLQQFTTLGEMAARSHNHSMQWLMPTGFERGSWNTDTLLGEQPVWGRWQDAPGVGQELLPILNQLVNVVVQRLDQLGRQLSVYGLIHADMRRANLLVHHQETRLIDFDDCGFGWYMYDFATAVSFIEDHPRLKEMKASWLDGYRKWRQPTILEVQEIDSLVMLRRLALLAWMGGHTEVPIVQELQSSFALVTANLAEGYLASARP